MILRENDSQVLSSIPIDLTFADLAKRIPASPNSGKLLKTAEHTFEKVQGIWHPRAVLRWLPVARVFETWVSLVLPEEEGRANLAMGFSSRFLQPAKMVVISVYTAGSELEREAKKASSERRHLDAYLYELIGLTVLEKTGEYVNKIVETRAAELGWKVGPFLSPGSVHGWDLIDQTVLCSLLPLQEIDVQVGKNGVLRPFNTVSCLIGIGPGYTAGTVSSTCQICSNNERCEMKKIREEK
jgi:hypothetical protein